MDAVPVGETGRVALAGPRALAGVLRRAEGQRDAVDTALLQHLLRDDDVAVARARRQRSPEMVRRRRPDRLDAWLDASHRSNIAELATFAPALARDLAAVRAGLTEPGSKGQVEGQVPRLKRIERAMHGRASPDPLRRRVLERGEPPITDVAPEPDEGVHLIPRTHG
jgi:hypothetical protein